MRRINVQAYEKALVFKNGKLIHVLPEGKHWVGFGVKTVTYDITEIFYHEQELDLLLMNDQFRSLVDIKIVKNNEIILQYKDGIFHDVLSPGRYCFWKEGIVYDNVRINLNDIEVDESIERKVLRDSKVSRYYTSYIVDSHEKGILYIDGKMEKIVDPGIYHYWKSEKSTIIKRIDMRRQQLEISGQELLTKDKAGIRVNLFANYEVLDIVKAVDKTKDYSRLLYIVIQMGIREYVGQYTLDALLANKTTARAYIMEFVQDKAAEMGVALIDCGIRDIILPGDMRNIMNQVLIAEKQAQAQVIMRREETASTRSLLNTAKLMENNEMLFRLKEMEYIEKISEKVGEITLNGGGQIMEQFRELITPR